jgi:peptidoglycan/LPS O-acetylase OafA/YrhL
MKARMNSIDSLRYVAILPVVFVHCFRGDDSFKFFWDQLSRFCIPFFFIASGYFLGLKLQKSDETSVYFKYIFRIFKLYVFWSIVFLLKPELKLINQVGIVKSYIIQLTDFINLDAETLFFRGVITSYWFFNSLMYTILFFWFFRLKNLKYFLTFSVILYIIGVLGKSYSDTAIGLNLHFDTRNFIFFSALPFGIGIYVAANKTIISLNRAYYLFLGGMLLHITESILLGWKYNDYVFSTIFSGVGLFFIGIHGNKILNNQTFSYLGQLTFGIYAIHLLVAGVVELFLRKFGFFEALGYYLFPILVLLSSTISVAILKRLPLINKMV